MHSQSETHFLSTAQRDVQTRQAKCSVLFDNPKRISLYLSRECIFATYSSLCPDLFLFLRLLEASITSPVFENFVPCRRERELPPGLRRILTLRTSVISRRLRPSPRQASSASAQSRIGLPSCPSRIIFDDPTTQMQ